jgi:hypothetical protein
VLPRAKLTFDQLIISNGHSESEAIPEKIDHPHPKRHIVYKYFKKFSDEAGHHIL